MTLGQMVEYICAKVGQSDEDSAAACRLFLRRRYAMLWDAALWRESLSVTEATRPTFSEIVTMPTPCDQVIAVRRGSEALRPLDQTTLMRYNPAAFDQSQGLLGFAMEAPSCLQLPPSQVAAEPVEQYTVQSTSAGDGRQLLTLTRTGLGPGVAGLPRPVREVVYLHGTLPVGLVYQYHTVSSVVLSEACAGEVQVLGPDASVRGQIEPGDLTMPALPRFRVFGSSAGDVFSVLFKRAAIDLLSDDAEPEMRTCANTLLAMATGDMLERQRQYGKAQLKMQEGAAQLQIMLDLEKNQSASEIRLVPEDIHGTLPESGWAFGGGGKGFW